MPSERIDSSTAHPASGVITHTRNQNAPLRRLERLASIPAKRLSDITAFGGGGNSAAARATAVQGGGKSEAAQAEFKLPIYREFVLPNRGDSGNDANFRRTQSGTSWKFVDMVD